MSLYGFIYDGATAMAVPDKALTKKSKPKLLRAKFGDGYEQRIADGINTQQETYTLSFKRRPKDFIDDVGDYLASTNGVTSFNIALPKGNSGSGYFIIKVVCEDFNINYEYDDYFTLTTTLKRVYEA